MSVKKLIIRQRFREDVFKRDKHRCRKCGWNEDAVKLDAHHITDRNQMPNGGYVKENGISLCPKCHELAEQYHSTGTPAPGYSPDELYTLIKSSYELALYASEKL